VAAQQQLRPGQQEKQQQPHRRNLKGSTNTGNKKLLPNENTKSNKEYWLMLAVS
jgi:hypothetical protein